MFAIYYLGELQTIDCLFSCLIDFPLERPLFITLKKVFKRNRPFEQLNDHNPILNVSEYDLVLSDFEPISAWVAKIRGIPSIGISHHCAFEHDIPTVVGYGFEKLLMRYFSPANTKIGLHWHFFDQPILPPLMEKQLQAEIKPNKILVYMGFEEIKDVQAFVGEFSEYEFHIYAKVVEKVALGHVTIHPLRHEGFHRDLSDASGVIANAGFELPSECLQLGKKLLIKPLLVQYEQACNALALQHLKRATIINTLDQDMLKSWLAIDAHPPVRYPFVAKYLAEWIRRQDYDDVQQLSQKLWGETSFSRPELSQSTSNITNGLIY